MPDIREQQIESYPG